MDIESIDYTRVIKTFIKKRDGLFTVGYCNGWLEFFRAGQLVGSIKIRQGFFEGISIDFFNGYFQPPAG